MNIDQLQFLNVFCRCLREIGYTDALLDARASRIRHLRNITGLPAEPNDNTSVVTGNRQARSEATEAV